MRFGNAYLKLLFHMSVMLKLNQTTFSDQSYKKPRIILNTVYSHLRACSGSSRLFGFAPEPTGSRSEIASTNPPRLSRNVGNESHPSACSRSARVKATPVQYVPLPALARTITVCGT